MLEEFGVAIRSLLSLNLNIKFNLSDSDFNFGENEKKVYCADVPQVVDLLTRENSFKENHERIWIYDTL